MHGVSAGLLKRQAQCLGLPLVCAPFRDSSGEEYAAAMADITRKFLHKDIQTALFGDIHLEAVRQRREENLKKAGMKAAFPLWGKEPKKLLADFIRLGFRAVITSVDGAVLDKNLVGKPLDSHFLRHFPANADCCGENGEYHSFVFDGPIFYFPVPFQTGAPICDQSGRYWYCRLE